MTTYDKVKALLEMNTLRGVGVKSISGSWKVFTHIRPDGALQGYYRDSTIKGCFQYGLSVDSHNEDYLNKDFTNEIVPIPMKPKVLPVGTKVRVLDIARECDEYYRWGNNAQKMVGRIATIDESMDSGEYGVHYKLKELSRCFWPAYCIVPVFEEENKERDELLAHIKKMEEELAEAKKKVEEM